MILKKDVAPDKKSSITRDAMLTYIKTFGTDEDKAWFKELCKNNQVEKLNNLTKQKVMGFDIKEMRKAFINRFYPNAYKKDKKDTKSEAKSFLDEVNAL